MKGIIRSNRNYTDGQPAFEIDIFLEYEGEFPLRHGERIASKFKIGTEEFISGIRFTEHAGAWMCPDLNNVYHGTKVRLSEILLKHGYTKNENVRLEYDNNKNEIIINKVSS